MHAMTKDADYILFNKNNPNNLYFTSSYSI